MFASSSAARVRCECCVPDAYHLPCQVVCCASNQHSHANQPIATDGLHERREEVASHLLANSCNCKLLRCCGQKAGIPSSEYKQIAANQVANKRGYPGLYEFIERDQALKECSGHRSSITSEQLATCHQDQQKVCRKQSRKNQLLKSRISSRNTRAASSYDCGKQPSL